MAVVTEAAFELEQFEWQEPDRLHVVGSWRGVAERELTSPVLVVRTNGATRRLPQLWQTAPTTRRGLWEASFAWDGPPTKLDAVRLEMGSGLVVELPTRPGRRRFGRTALEVSRSEHEERGPDRLRLHAQLVSAREEAEATKETARQAREELWRARQDLERERERGKAETARMREAFATAQTLAEEALGEERAEAERLGTELAQIREQAESARGETHELRGRLEAAEGAQQELARERDERARLGAELERVRALAQDAVTTERDAAQQLGERVTTLERTLEAERADAERMHAGLRAAVEVGEQEVLQARTDLERAQGELAGVQAAAERAGAEASGHAHEAAQLREEAGRLRAEIDDARRTAARAGGEAERLQGELAQVRGVAEEATAQARRHAADLEEARQAAAEATENAGRLWGELEEARRVAADSGAQVERLREKLAAVRRAFEDPA